MVAVAAEKALAHRRLATSVALASFVLSAFARSLGQRVSNLSLRTSESGIIMSFARRTTMWLLLPLVVLVVNHAAAISWNGKQSATAAVARCSRCRRLRAAWRRRRCRRFLRRRPNARRRCSRANAAAAADIRRLERRRRFAAVERVAAIRLLDAPILIVETVDIARLESRVAAAARFAQSASFATASPLCGAHQADRRSKAAASAAKRQFRQSTRLVAADDQRQRVAKRRRRCRRAAARAGAHRAAAKRRSNQPALVVAEAGARDCRRTIQFSASVAIFGVAKSTSAARSTAHRADCWRLSIVSAAAVGRRAF